MSGSRAPGDLPQFEDMDADGDSPSSKQAREFRDEAAVRDGEAPDVGEPGVNPLVEGKLAKDRPTEDEEE